MKIDYPTMHERIPSMTDEQLDELATSRALTAADSSRLEGLTLDQDLLKAEFLAGYKKIREEANASQA